MPGQFIYETASDLNAAARGTPGQRTFYLVVGQDRSWVRIWMEKTQLEAFGATIEQLLVSLDPNTSPDAADPSVLLTSGDPPGDPVEELQLGRLAVAHDQERDMIIVLVQDQQTATPTFLQFWASKPQMSALSKRIAEVCAAGRPLCPLCGAPVEASGHVCARSNGHHH